MTKKYQAPIVKKAFDILKVISKSEKGVGISDAASRLEMSKSTVHGIFHALEEQGAIVQDPGSKKFTVGLTLMELGKAAYERVDIRKVARPAMETLMAQCRETVFLGIRNGNRVTIIDTVESSKDFKISSPIGTSLPLLAGALGKVFLAALPPNEALDFIRDAPLPRFTPHTILKPGKYLKELDRVKQQGYAFDDEEYIIGVRAVAVPLDPRGGHAPAIWVVGFKAGMGDEKISQIIQQAKEAALQINATA